MLSRNLFAVATVAALSALAHPALAQLPAHATPKGMTEVSTGGGGGRILTTKLGGTASARKMILGLKMLSGEYFDKPFVITRAFADQGDRYAQAAWTTTLRGVPVRGVASVAMDGDGGEGTLVFDNAKTFEKSFAHLLTRLGGGNRGGGGKGMAPVKLTPQQAPDGSCKISLPPGYRIVNSYQGTLDIVGPNKEIMGLGGPMICTSYQGGRMFPGMPAVDFNNPVQAMLDCCHFMSRKNGIPMEVKILDARPVPGWTTGRAAYIRYTMIYGGKYAGKSDEGFGLFSISQTDTNQAMFYQSFIVAPHATYRTQLPAMLQAWGTWSISPDVFTKRLLAAAQSMRGISDIITGSNANTQATNARVSTAWSDMMRDQGTWSNPNDGTRYKVSNTVTNPVVNGTALEPVPLRDL